MEINVPVGMTYTIERTVDEAACTGHLGGGGKGFVYATPIMVGWMEEASYTAIRPALPEGYDSVGTNLHIFHNAPTPLGMKVKVVSEVIESKGKLLNFKVEAFDERGKIAEGTHGRAIVEVDKFLEMVNNK
ncbi:MAG: thioesterase family protein [Firmicutes bacterium]|nr:thioesterase family protein [Bacillota bacterium]